MKNVDRALQELTHFARVRGGELNIVFSSSPIMLEVDGKKIPHAWQCHCGVHQEIYIAHGITMDEAILKCYSNWMLCDTK